MKRKSTILSALLLSSIFALSACNNNNTSTDSSDNSSTESKDNTIIDAYDEDRPSYDDFDYDSNYEPVPPDVNVKPIVVKLDSSPFTFADGSKSKEFSPNYTFKEEDFDLSKIDDDRNLSGFALYTTNDNDFKGTFAFGELKAPKVDITIKPYFSPKEGYLALDIGSGKDGKFNYDQVPGSITNNKTIKYNSDVLVKGGESGYTEVGCSFVETSFVDINSAIRLDSKGQSVIDAAGIYEFTYNFENLGDYPLHFDCYQISASSEYKGKYDYESRYRIDIDLNAGESIYCTAQYSLGQNGNALTYIVADRSMPNGFSLGMSMSIKKTALTEVDSKYDSEPEEATKGKVKLHLPDGISVNNYVEEQTAGVAITIPSDDQITNTSGKEIAGWYIEGDPIKIIDSTVVVSDLYDYTIAPYFTSNYGTDLVPGTNAKGDKTLPDYTGHTLTDGTLDNGDDSNMVFAQKDTLIDGIRGKNFSSSYEFSNGDYFRLLTKGSILASTKYKFHYTLKNNSNEPISLTTYQVQSGIKISSEDGAISVAKTIAAKSITTFDIEIKITSKNDNIMTVFVMDSASNGLDLDIAIAMDTALDVTNYTLTLEGNSGITFKDGTTSVSLKAGETLPEITNNTTRTLLGFYNDDGKYTSETFVMPSDDTTLRPYFDVESGFARIYAMSGKSGGLPNNVSGGIESSSFEGTNSSTGDDNVKDAYKTIVKSSLGFDEEGLIVKTKSGVTLPANCAFRFDCQAKPALGKQITKNVEHTYSFNFENRATNSMSFDVYAINSGKDTSSGTNNHFEVTLEAGAYTSISINPTFTGGSNNDNALIYFVAKEEMASLNMAISIAIKLGE